MPLLVKMCAGMGSPSPALRLFTSVPLFAEASFGQPYPCRCLDLFNTVTSLSSILIVAGYMLLRCTPVDKVFASWTMLEYPYPPRINKWRILKHCFQAKCDGEQVRLCLTAVSSTSGNRLYYVSNVCVCVEWSQAVWLWYTHQSTNRRCRNPIAGYDFLSL